MGKMVPNRLKEVVYTLSPFETSVMSGLWKDLPSKIQRKVSEVQMPFHPSSKAAKRVQKLSLRTDKTTKQGFLFIFVMLPATVRFQTASPLILSSAFW